MKRKCPVIRRDAEGDAKRETVKGRSGFARFEPLPASLGRASHFPQ